MRNRSVILTAAAVCAAVCCMMKMTKLMGEYRTGEGSRSYGGLEQLLPDIDPSSNTTFGKIYTLDGRNMLRRQYFNEEDDGSYTAVDIDGESGEGEIRTRFDSDRSLFSPTERWYANIVGGPGECGLLYTARNILQSYSSRVNARRNEGDYIITTIYSKAQEQAYKELQEFIPLHDDDGFAAIAVVSADGAILVDAGSNADAAYDHFAVDMAEYAVSPHTDENGDYIPPPAVPDKGYIRWDLAVGYPDFTGSSFKPITARVLEQNDHLLGKEFSVRNDDYVDHSWTKFEGEDIKNHDSVKNEEGVPVDETTVRSLQDALVDSSNVYFLDHVKKLGTEKYKDELIRLFHLDSYENIGTELMEPIFLSSKDSQSSVVATNIGKVAYGQDARLSAVREASLMNTCITGIYYKPFIVSEVLTPEYNSIYKMQTERRMEKRMDIDIKHDIVADGMKRCFESYTDWEGLSSRAKDTGRFLAKSGTADANDNEGMINRTMVLTALDEEGRDVVCTAVLAINKLKNTDLSNDYLVEKLLSVIDTLGVI